MSMCLQTQKDACTVVCYIYRLVCIGVVLNQCSQIIVAEPTNTKNTVLPDSKFRSNTKIPVMALK